MEQVTKRIRLAHIITGLEPGGCSVVLRTIAEALDRNRFELDVFCIHEGGEQMEEELRRLGCGVTVIEGAWDYRRKLLPYSPTKTLQLASLLRRGRYDVVHTHLFYADVIGRLAAFMAGVPVVVKSLHNMGQWKKRRHVLTDRLLARGTDKVVFCSDFQREVASAQEHVPDAVGITIHHGVKPSTFDKPVDRAELARALGLRPDRRTIGTVGRSIPEKGHARLVEAMPRIVSRHEDVQFLFVGDGPLRTQLEDKVARLGYRDRVCFAGSRTDIPEMLALMDVFAFPSLIEGLGIAAIEAMAARLPVVASRIRPLSEIVIDGQTGWLVDPESPEAFASRICELLGSAHLCSKFGGLGRRRVEEQFSDAKMVCAYQDLYVSLCQAAAARRGESTDPLLCH